MRVGHFVGQWRAIQIFFITLLSFSSAVNYVCVWLTFRSLNAAVAVFVQLFAIGKAPNFHSFFFFSKQKKKAILYSFNFLFFFLSQHTNDETSVYIPVRKQMEIFFV